jgi:hypothetical protein
MISSEDATLHHDSGPFEQGHWIGIIKGVRYFFITQNPKLTKIRGIFVQKRSLSKTKIKYFKNFYLP